MGMSRRFARVLALALAAAILAAGAPEAAHALGVGCPRSVCADGADRDPGGE